MLGTRHIPAQLGLSPAEQRSVARAAWARFSSGAINVALYAGAFILSLAGSIVVYKIVSEAFGPFPGGADLLIVGSLNGVVLLGVGLAAVRLHLRPYVCTELRARGHDVCPRCGYLLAGLAPGCQTCPECGAGLGREGGGAGGMGDPTGGRAGEAP